MQDAFLGELPSELLLHLLSFLSHSSLLSLSRTSRSFHSLIQSTVLPRFALSRLNYSPSTLKHLHDHRNTRQRWTWGKKALWAERVGRRWSEWEFSGVSFGGWERTMPVVKLWQVEKGVAGVLIARGRGLEWWVAVDVRGTMDCVQVVVKGYDQGYGRKMTKSALDDITALTEGGRAGEIIVARVSGVVQRLKVVDLGGRGRPIVLEETTRYSVPQSDRARPGSTAVQALHSTSNVLVSASTTRLRPPNPREVALDENDSLAHTLMKRAAPKRHQVSVHSIVSPWQSPAVIPLSSKPWAVQLAPSPSPSWLAIGQSGTSPLTLVQLDSTGTPVPSSSTSLARTSKSTSVYSLTTPSLDCSPFLRPDQTLIAAFFDATTRIYDLRIPTSPSSSSSALTTVSNWNDDDSPSNEILRLCDPWSDDPSYSVASGGPLGAYIAVGSARNSAVRIFDIRNPSHSTSSKDSSSSRSSRGITAFGPKGDRSPVYGLSVENSRIWGVTEKSGFVFNFHADERDGRGEERVAYVGHEGEGKGELKRTGERLSRKNRVSEIIE